MGFYGILNGILMGLNGFYGTFMGFEWDICWLPSGKRLRSEVENPSFLNR